MRFNREDFYSHKFLKAEDLKDGQQLTIEKVEILPSDLKKSGKTIAVFFKGNDVPLSLNATNFDALSAKFGDDSDKWIGKKVTVSKSKVTNFKTGGDVDGVRLN